MQSKLYSRSTRAVILIVVLLTVALACGTTPTDNGLNVETRVALTVAAGNNGSTEPTVGSCNVVNYNGISLCYDPSIAQGVTTSTIPAVPNSEDPWFASPQTDQIDFTGYVNGEKFHDPRVMVFSVEEYKALYAKTGEVVSNLQQYIANQPNIPAGPIPFLPSWNAMQLFYTMPAFVAFQNGQGIRYLAEYGQYNAPVNNTDLFYTFQGITNDGVYYVSVIMPVTHASLPPDYNVNTTVQDQINANYQVYLSGILPGLAAQPLNSFSPNISLLDAMVQSMRIH
jgi:hypothetical protein